MTYPTEDHNREQEFEQAWKQYARRPPRLSAAEAAHRVRNRLSTRSPVPNYWGFAAAAALVLAAALVVLWTTLPDRPAKPGPIAESSVEQAPLSNGEVVMWLDDRTPLYMTFQAPNDGAQR
jgi:ferric-dicitrate binding protein FerR (iron transport regulator)